MKIRTVIATGAASAGLLFAAAPANAMLPPTEGGWSPSSPSDCSWDCVSQVDPKLYKKLLKQQQKLASLGGEPTKKIVRKSNQLSTTSMTQEEAEQLIKTLIKLLNQLNEQIIKSLPAS